MDFSLSEEQAVLRETIIRFATREINPLVEGDRFSRHAWEKCGGMRLMGLPFSEEHGGCGVDFLSTALAIYAFGYACRDAGLVHAVVTQILCGLQLRQFGSEEQKQKYLPDLCSGRRIFAQAITEAGSGSDALAMRTRARRKDGSYFLDGAKMFISNGPLADAVIVFAVTNPEARTLEGISCLIVDKEFPGFQRCKPIEKMGLNSLQNGEIVFEGTPVPEGNLLGREGQGAIIFNESMEWERSLLPASHLGTLERIFETCVRHARERKAFGQSIGKFQSVAHKIAEMKMNLELGKLILFKSAVMKEEQKRAAMEASIGKLFISESLKKACLDAVQIHGGYGYMSEYGIERDLRDSIASTIYSGTSELQKNIIARLIGL